MANCPICHYPWDRDIKYRCPSCGYLIIIDPNKDKDQGKKEPN